MRINISFQLALIPRLRDEKQGVKERDKLRKGTKNYYAVYRDEQGLIKKAVSYVGGEADVTYFAVYKGNKRYLLPFSDDWQGRYPTYTIVAEYSGGEIIREYMADDSQIVYYGYEKRSEEEYRVEVINYIPNGDYPVNAYEVFTVSLVNGIEYSDERSYSWYDEFNCQRKGLPYTQALPESMIVADMTEEQLNEEFEKGYTFMQEGNTMTADTAFAKARCLFFLTLTDTELSYGDHTEDFCIGLFFSEMEAKLIAEHYLKNVKGFCEYPCTYRITQKKIIGILPCGNDSSCVWMLTGWNTNADLEEIDVVESDCYADESQAYEALDEMKAKYPRSEWTVNRWIIGKCDWESGFSRSEE